MNENKYKAKLHMDIEKKEKEYEAKIHVATSPFSFIEVVIKGSSKEIIDINERLLSRYSDNQNKHV